MFNTIRRILKQETAMSGNLRRYEMARYTADDWRDIQQIVVSADAFELADVSFYQHVMEWDEYVKHSDAAFIRLGQGNWVDTAAEYNYTEARKRGIRLGGYWFYDGRYSPQVQHSTLKTFMSGKKLDMEIVTDWERNFGGAHEGLANATAFMQLTESVSDPAMYTGYYWFVNNSNAITNAGQYNYLKTKPLWLAWYAAASTVKVPLPWTDWTYWQYGTPVVDWGQATQKIDMNKYNGNKQKFNSVYGGTVTPPPTGGTMYRVKVKSTATPYVNIRALPSTSSADIGDVYPNQEFDADYYELDANGKKFDHAPSLNGYVMRDYTNVISGTEVPKPADPPPTAETLTVTVGVQGYSPASITNTFTKNP